MAKRKGRHPKGGRVTPKATGARPLTSRPTRDDRLGGGSHRDNDLLRTLKRLLRGEPLDLLAFVSSMIDMADPRNLDPLQRRNAHEHLDPLDETLLALTEVPARESTALVAAAAALIPDQLLRTKLRRAIADRRHLLPSWLDQIEGAKCTHAIETTHVLGDGENVMVEVTIPGGGALTVVAYIDHNMGTLVKDAFIVPQRLDQLAAQFASFSEEDPDAAQSPITLGDARARIEQALDRSNTQWPPFEGDTWPACRPILEWTLRMLPEGGAGFEQPEWTDEQLADLTERFFASPYGAPLDDELHRDLLESILWFGAGYPPGDPMRWTNVNVEILLCGFLPRKVIADDDILAKAPDVLRSFVRFCHAERGIRAEHTADALASVDEFEPLFLELLRGAEPMSKLALMEAAGVISPDGEIDIEAARVLFEAMGEELPHVPETNREYFLGGLAQEVGADNLWSFDDVPLPDEPFDWDGIPTDLHATVDELVALVDGFCDEHLDIEHRAACRRFIALALRNNPGLLRRKGSLEGAAAGIIWAIGKANSAFARIYVADVAEHFGVQPPTPASRGSTWMKAAGFAPPQNGWVLLGRVDLLTGAYRARLLEDRARYDAMDD